jgi:hypothetical protein
MVIVRDFVHTLLARMQESHPLIQTVLGPRQVGKTTGVSQLLDKVKGPTHYVAADDTLHASNRWIQEAWQEALQKGPGTILVIDEIQKIPNWAEVVKRLWDEQRKQPKLKLILLGSSSLSLQKGLTESLTGRFELISVFHWSFPESQKAFGYNLDTYLRFGGYPGADAYIKDYPRWFSYLKSSVVDTVVGQDILTHQTVAKPALFRQAFEILCSYPAQEVSYRSLLGQLQDRGNTDLIKHYIELYEGAYLFRTLSKYSARPVKIKSSSPKIIPLCPALYTLAAGAHALDDPDKKGHLFEAVVGADLLRIHGAQVYYWRDSSYEVDYVLFHEGRLYAIEVKSRRRRFLGGIDAFQKRFKKAKACVITMENYAKFSQAPLEFLTSVSVS